MKVATGGRDWQEGKQALTAAFQRIIPSLIIDGATAPGYTPGDPIYLSHSLGEKPQMFSFMAKGNFIVYINDGDELSWTDQKIVVRCTAAGVKFRLTLEGTR
jgi:hypothetical protein